MIKEKRQWRKELKLLIIQQLEVNDFLPTLCKYNLSQSLFNNWKNRINNKWIMGLEPKYYRVDPEKPKVVIIMFQNTGSQVENQVKRH